MADSKPTMAEELAALKTITREVADNLRKQDEILRSRGMKLPPGVIQSLSALIKDIANLENNIGGDAIELNQLRALAATGAMINSTLDVDDVLAKALDQVIDLTGAERGFMILKNENSGELEFRISRDTTNKNGGGVEKTPEISMTIVNEVVNTGNPMRTDNAYKDPRIQDHMSVAQFVLRSVICVPLRQRNKIIGVVYVDNRLRAGVFTERELNLLIAFANQAAVAIENARLFARIQSTLREITEIKDVMDSVFASVGSSIITTNANNVVITFNRAAETLFSRTSDGTIGQPLASVLPRMDEIDLETQLQTVMETNTDAQFQTSVHLPNREDIAILGMKFSPLVDDKDGIQGVTVVVDDLTDQNERESMLNVLQNYLPPGMMGRIHEIAGIDLGGERREMTCMFAESRPFNSFPAETTPAELMTLINRYLSVGTEAVHFNEGVIDKYMGSELMVLFNTQLNPQPDHSLRAIYTALDIRDAFLEFYKTQGIDPDPHFYRIGIHTGIATLGNVGSMYRRNFTAIGDTINLSKRLEENATAGQIIISEDLLQHAQAVAGSESLPGVRIEEREPIKVKGRQQFTRIFEVFRED
jgi:adenylate cyclase